MGSSCFPLSRAFLVLIQTSARRYAEAPSKVEHGLRLVPDQEFQNSSVSILDRLPGQNVFQCLLGRSVEDKTA